MEDEDLGSTVEVEIPKNDAESRRDDQHQDRQEARRNRADDDDDDSGSVSRRTQKRIDRLTAKLRDSERVTETKEYEASQLRKQLLNAHKNTAEFHGQSATQAVENARVRLKSAIESGVIDDITAAQEALTDAKIEARDATRIKQRVEQDVRRVEEEPQQQQRQPLKPEVQEWIDRNPWFTSNPAMQTAARAIERNLDVRNKIKPGSKKSLAEIEKRIRASFPDEFEDDDNTGRDDEDEDGEDIEDDVAPPRREQRPPRPSSDSRQARNGGAQVQGNKVRLSVDQAELAKTMGLTPKQYADQFLKLRKEGKI